MTGQNLGAYAQSLFGDEDPVLREIREEAVREGLPEIQVPMDLARLLALLVRQSGARRALEIGTLFGYSGTVIARALPEEGRLITLEANEKHAEFSRRSFERTGVSRKVEVRLGPALESLEDLRGSEFDLVFIDADKDNYPHYLDWALQLTRAGGLIIADNVWRGGAVTEPQDPAAMGMAQFNRKLAENQRLLSTFVATRDCGDAASISLVLE